MAPKIKVLSINLPTDESNAALLQGAEDIELTVIPQGNREEMIVSIAEAVEKQGPFKACCIFLNWAQRPFPWPLDEGLVKPLVDTGCIAFCGGGAGYDWVDDEYLSSVKVLYHNTPTCVGERTADTCAMMILQAIRNSTYQEQHLRAGKWLDRARPAMDARKSTLGIVGMGNIGQMVADHMRNFGMKIIYYNRSRLSPEKEKGAKYVTMDELLATADVVSLNCPLNKATFHLIGAPEISKMKDNVIIVNTSRGPVVDEQALVDALESGKVYSAALDVFEREPEIHPGLIKSDRTILSPHNAVVNVTVKQDQELEIINNVLGAARTGTGVTPVNGPFQR